MTKGTRLPDGWQPDEADMLKLSREFPGFNLASELENFRDYWTAKAGAAATKMDWRATYRIWMRKAGKAPRAKNEPYRAAPAIAPSARPEPDHLLYFANRLLFAHLRDRNGIGATELESALKVKKDLVEWFRQPILDGDGLATPREFLLQFGKALAKVSPLSPATRARWRKALKLPEAPFEPFMARSLG